MSGRVLIVKNMEREGPGLLRDVLQDNDVEADVVELEKGDEIPPLDPYSALIILGGTPSANDETSSIRAQLEATKEALRSGVAVLGICLGHQILGKAAGGSVAANPVKEVGLGDADGRPYTVTLCEAGKYDPLFEGVPEEFRVFQLHGEAVGESPELEVLATSKHTPIQAIRAGRRAYGLQMHVEVVPEMLAIWCGEDPFLQLADTDAIQQEFVEIYDEYQEMGRRILTNFLGLAGIASTIEVDLGETDVR